jgi:endogenous inhibitor of DNA gyrase (YacG/DUF329 family)
MLRACPICKTISDSASNPEFPFCSDRCRERDLGNWAAEKYVVSEPIFDEDVEDALEDLDDAPEPNDAHH